MELSEKSLKSMEEEAKITKNLISEYEELHKALVEAKTKAKKDQTREGADKDPTAAKAEELDKKIRYSGIPVGITWFSPNVLVSLIHVN